MITYAYQLLASTNGDCLYILDERTLVKLSPDGDYQTHWVLPDSPYDLWKISIDPLGQRLVCNPLVLPTAYTSSALPEPSCPPSNPLLRSLPAFIDNRQFTLTVLCWFVTGRIMCDLASIRMSHKCVSHIKPGAAPSANTLTYDVTAALTSGECTTTYRDSHLFLSRHVGGPRRLHNSSLWTASAHWSRKSQDKTDCGEICEKRPKANQMMISIITIEVISMNFTVSSSPTNQSILWIQCDSTSLASATVSTTN